MFKGKKIAVVVPAYNEENQIGMVIETMPSYVDHIVIVDDGSKDQTVAKAKEYQQCYDNIVLLEHPVNQGVGGAISTGYKWVRNNDIDVAVVMAGDAQMDPKDLPAILDPVVSGEVDYAKGNRLTSGEAYKKIPKIRYFGNSMLTLLTKIASGYWHITDSQTGYTAINKKALKLIDWDTMYKRYGQPNDLLVRLNIYNMKVRDVTIEPIYNVGEKSGIKVRKVMFTISWLLLKLFFWRLKEKYVIRDFHPLVFFYLLGFALFFVSLAFLGRVVDLWIVTGHIPRLSALAFVFSSIMSAQTSFFAMWMDSDYNRNLVSFDGGQE